MIRQATIFEGVNINFERFWNSFNFHCWLHNIVTKMKFGRSGFWRVAQPTANKKLNNTYILKRNYIKLCSPNHIKSWLRKLTSTEFTRLATVTLNQLISVSDVNLCRTPFWQCLTKSLVAGSAFGQIDTWKGSFAWHVGWISVYACCR